MTNYQNFDPLDLVVSSSSSIEILNDSKKREIRNVLKCYTGYFDLFSELLQNALDACERRWRANSKYRAFIDVTIDLYEKSVTVSDNGTGMTKETFEYCLAPNISFKTGESLRGNKGVGATFLAYGYNNIKIHTKSPGFEARVQMSNGKSWIENIIEARPKFHDLVNNIDSFLEDKDCGTTFKVYVQQGDRPNLFYLKADSAEQWFTVLRIKTPLGGIYLTSTNDGQFRPTITVRVVNSAGSDSVKQTIGADYYFPHEIPNLKVQSINEIETAMANIGGSPQEKFGRLADTHKKLNAVYEIWDANELLQNKDKVAQGLSEEQLELINICNISVYGFFCNSTRIFDRFNDDVLQLRKNYRILRGGLQMASDGMPQGEIITIPLSRYIGYQEQTHVIVHFQNGEPDLGRKTFQKEKSDLGEHIAKNVVEACRRYRAHLKSDETSEPLSPDRDRHEWIRFQEDYFSKSQVVFQNAEIATKIKILSQPQKEQDVIALFHQMIAAGVLKGIQIYSTSEHTRYDSVYRLCYEDENVLYSSSNVLGISNDVQLDYPYITEPKVLEYKYDFDALIRECLSNEKYHKHINLVVAWNVSLRYLDKVELKSLLIDNRGGAERLTFGATHLAYLSGHYESHIYEVIILKDLISFLNNRTEEISNQYRKYKDF